jgi:hypothetical protein
MLRAFGLAGLVPTDKTWKVLEDAIHEINNHNASGLSFEELYRCASLARQPQPKRHARCLSPHSGCSAAISPLS